MRRRRTTCSRWRTSPLGSPPGGGGGYAEDGDGGGNDDPHLEDYSLPDGVVGGLQVGEYLQHDLLRDTLVAPEGKEEEEEEEVEGG